MPRQGLPGFFTANVKRNTGVQQTNSPANLTLPMLPSLQNKRLALKNPATNLVTKNAGFVKNLINAVGNSWRFAVDPQRESNKYVEGAIDHLQSSGKLNKLVSQVSNTAGRSAVKGGLSQLGEKVKGGITDTMGYVADGADQLHPLVGSFIRKHPLVTAGGLAAGTGAALYNLPRIVAALSRLKNQDDDQDDGRKKPRLQLEGSPDVRKRLKAFRERIQRRYR